jgi:hypothetical protein
LTLAKKANPISVTTPWSKVVPVVKSKIEAIFRWILSRLEENIPSIVSVEQATLFFLPEQMAYWFITIGRNVYQARCTPLIHVSPYGRLDEAIAVYACFSAPNLSF